MLFALKGKPSLMKASEAVINDLARSRVGEVLAPTEARVVDRPAPRFTFPAEPMVALRGAGRSLRHGGDGRGSADGKLTCRWPTHVITEISGVIAKDRFIRSLGNGSVPSEALALAREALLHDPYHDEWVAAAVAPAGAGRTAVLNRLKAESVLRFGHDGTYDGTTVALNPTVAKTARARRAQAAKQTPQPGVREQQALVSDEMRKFSLYKGADPDLVGVTTWAQPWVPMWLEWELKVEGLDPPTLDAWKLGALDLGTTSTTIEGGTATLRGRAQLTAGAAATLHDAITDWLKKEDALDDDGAAGLVDEATEDAYRQLDTAVRHLDVMTATLDGLRTQLLGLPVNDGLRRPKAVVGVSNPAPVAPPHALLAGCVTLTRARLLDVFGRTLDVPLANVTTPTRATLAARPGALAMRPRLLRPSRWLFRLVDAATPAGAEGTEARVDQIETALQVNPVAGFVMPDHLDESLELFGVDGSPIGELLHEPASGGVMWEIAAGREGPADAGPHHGLAPAQEALGDFAAALVAADAAAREGAPLGRRRAARERLSALLRAIDTTLWTVDSFAALGSEHVAGLVGRPIAVVRAQLRLELRPPVDIDLSDAQRAAEWARAERDAARHAFPVRIGELTRSDDGVLGFFVNDDYSRFRLVDKAIAATAAEAGRSRGQLGVYDTSSGMPPLERHRPPVHRRHRRRRHAAAAHRPDGHADHPDAPRRQGHADVGRAAAQGTRAGARLGRPGARGHRALAAHRARAGGDRPGHRGPGAPAQGVGVRQGPELPLARHASHLAHRRDPRSHADRAAARHPGRIARRAGSAWRRQKSREKAHEPLCLACRPPRGEERRPGRSRRPHAARARGVRRRRGTRRRAHRDQHDPPARAACGPRPAAAPTSGSRSGRTR